MKNKKGFTLVEVIIVVVIMAILAAIFMPALTGYIEKSNVNTYITMTRNVFNISQTSLNQCYIADRDSVLKRTDITSYGGNNVARISNYMMNLVQCTTNPSTIKSYKQQYGADYDICEDILEYLESRDKSTAEYHFNCTTRMDKLTAAQYLAKYDNDIGITILYSKDAKVILVQIAIEDYLITVTEDEARYSQTEKALYTKN